MAALEARELPGPGDMFHRVDPAIVLADGLTGIATHIAGQVFT